MGASEHLNLLRAVVLAKKRFGGPRLGAGVPGPSADAQAKLLKNIHRELAQAKNFKLCIISSERFGMYIKTQEEMDALRAVLLPYFKKIEVIVYLRPQVDLAVSRYSTELRKGVIRKTVLPDFSVRPRYKPVYDYEGLLAFWERAFPEAKIRPQIFSPQDLVSGDAVEDFLYRIRLKAVPTHEGSTKNASFNAAAQSYLWAVNWLVSRGAQLNTRRIIQKLHADFSGRGRMPSRADAAAFMAKFEQANEEIRAKYFPDRAQLFAVDFKKFPVDETPLGMSDADYAAITLAITGRRSKLKSGQDALPHMIEAELLKKPTFWERLARALRRRMKR